MQVFEGLGFRGFGGVVLAVGNGKGFQSMAAAASSSFNV